MKLVIWMIGSIKWRWAYTNYHEQTYKAATLSLGETSKFEHKQRRILHQEIPKTEAEEEFNGHILYKICRFISNNKMNTTKSKKLIFSY